MQFRTQIPIKKSDHPIDYDSKVVAFGSCFAVNMAEKFAYFKLPNTVNPFGILFHPLALEKSIDFALSGKVFDAADLFFHNGQWHCFAVHSELSNPDQNQLLDRLNGIVKALQVQLHEATHLILTLGTAWVYRNTSTQEIVANCHKIPQKQFTKELLPVSTIEAALETLIAKIQTVNPHCKMLFTVSPVRHIKDGFAENQRSKSHLIAAVHSVLENQDTASYFPSYEILMDELRDYRFYTADMLHPNALAVDYIWERFSQTHISEESHATMDVIDNIQKALAHRPFYQESEQHQLFLHNLQQKIERLQTQFPQIQF